MALSGIQRTFVGVLNSIWGKNAQTTIPTQPVSGIAYRDTDAEFESGQKYDSLGESSRWNQLLYLLTGLTSELANFGILPWSSAQSYTKGALSIAPNGGLYQAQVNIAANVASPVQPGTNNAVWAVPDIPGYVLTSRKIIAGTGLSGGGSLETDRTLKVSYGTAAGTACQGNDARVTASEAFRLSMIGVPRYWRSTTLPVGHVWANGDLALFADWPELKKIYDAGGFAGMLLAYNANSATIAANLGKWRPNAANPTGLYVPNLSEQFFRAWTGAGREAGSWQGDAVQPGFTQLLGRQAGTGGGCIGPVSASGGVTLTTKDTAIQYGLVSEASELAVQYTWKSTQRIAAETHPVNVAFPVCLYLGLPA
ncbi:MAG: hypothetical protein MEBIL_02918 [Bilophila sp.]